MGLFEKKKKSVDGFHTLSEREIQNKLYGVFRPPHPASSDIIIPHTEKSSSASVMVQEPPAMESSRATAEKKWAVTSQRMTPSAKNQSKSAQKAPGISWEKALETPLRWLFFGLPRILFGISKALVQWFLGLDFQNPGVRRGAIIIASSLLFISLFFGIHLLNVSREQAMKKTPRSSANPPAPSTSLSAPESSQKSAPVEIAKKETSASASPLAPVENVSSPAAPVSVSTDKPYVVQVATYAGKKDAEVLVERFRKEQIPCFVKPLSRAGAKTYYCVFFGGFSDYREAEKTLTEFRKKPIAKPFQDAFVRTLG